MASSTIRIHDKTKSTLQDYIEEFKLAHNVNLTMDQVINKLLQKPPAHSKDKTQMTSKKRSNRKPEILKLHKQGMKAADIAKQLDLSVRYCREVIQFGHSK